MATTDPPGKIETLGRGRDRTLASIAVRKFWDGHANAMSTTTAIRLSSTPAAAAAFSPSALHRPVVDHLDPLVSEDLPRLRRREELEVGLPLSPE